MIPYIVCFAFSCIFSGMDEYFKNRKCKKMSVFCAVMAILIPSFLAGARDIGVGTDTEVYISPLYHTILNHHYSFLELLLSPYSEIEPLTLVISFLAAKFFKNIFFSLFFIELVCVTPVYLAIRESDIKSVYKWIGLFAYFCLFYCYTLNIMRQMMAVCLLLYFYKYLKQGRTGKYLVMCLLLGLLVHKSALIGMFVWIIYASSAKRQLNFKNLRILRKQIFRKRNVFDRINKRLYSNKSILLPIYMLAAAAFLFLAKKIVAVLALVKKSYIYQLEHMNSSFNLSLAALILMIMYIAPVIFMYQNYKKKSSEYRFFFFSAFISMILWQLQGVSPEIYRVVLYIWFYMILAIPYFIQGLSRSSNRIVVSSYYVVLMFLNWYYYFVICGSGEVIPYTSEILGIR